LRSGGLPGLFEPKAELPLWPLVSGAAIDLWSRRRVLTLVGRPDAGWVCSRFPCAPATTDARPVALWRGKTALESEA